MQRRPLPALALTLVAFTLAAHAHDAPVPVGDLILRDGWSRAARAGAQGSGYLDIENRGIAPDRLIAAETTASRTVELHTHVRDGDIMRMRRVDALDIPPGTTVRLEPGGLHVMLIGLTAPLDQGGTIHLTLVFERAGRVEIPLRVQAAGARAPAH